MPNYKRGVNETIQEERNKNRDIILSSRVAI